MILSVINTGRRRSWRLESRFGVRTVRVAGPRISLWRRWPRSVRPLCFEVGSGTGAFAERCEAELSCKVTAVDSSQEMVAATAARGIRAMLGDVQDLPFPDGTFDAAVAAGMLYHVSDRDRAISELARVLRPGGRLVAITNGRDHLAELWQAVGHEGFETGFSGRTGARSLDAISLALCGTTFIPRPVPRPGRSSGVSGNACSGTRRSHEPPTRFQRAVRRSRGTSRLRRR